MTYEDRVNRMALMPKPRDPADDPFILLTGQLAALCCTAADNGHVTPQVHVQLEQFIGQAEAKMNALH